MRGKARRFLEKWGHYFLAALCAAVILLSGLWTREQMAREERDAQAISDAGQRLSDVTAPPPAFSPLRPCEGEVLRPFSESPVYFPALGLWQTHPGVDFAAGEGCEVTAMGDGTVTQTAPTVRLDHGNGYVSVYAGLGAVGVRPGQSVRARQVIGTAGAEVAHEGPGHVCVRLEKAGVPVPFGDSWLTNEGRKTKIK